jgi:CO/xanthine dehydrogenase Mo-binding subunit
MCREASGPTSGIAGIRAATANAIRRATGKRVRALPITADKPV